MRKILTPMTTGVLLAAAAAFTSSSAVAATAFWSFQVLPAGTSGTGGGGTLAITENNGFAGIPFITTSAGTGPTATSGTTTGGTQYISPFTGTTYAGAGNSSVPGYSMTWATTQTTGAALLGASFTISLNTTGLTDLTVAFDIRAATSNGSFVAPSSFSAIEYSLNGVDWFTTGATSPTWASGSGTSFAAKTVDLTAANAIENQSSVQLRFTFADGSVPTSAVNQNIRIDNLVINAVPEPASTMLAAIAAGGFLVRRRRA